MIVLKVTAALLLLAGTALVFWALRLFDQVPEPSVAPRKRAQMLDLRGSTEQRAA